MKLEKTNPLIAWALVALIGLVACQGGDGGGEADEADTLAQAQDTAPAASLYDRLGGEAAIRLVVDDFVARAAADDTLNFTRQGTDNVWDATPENVQLLKDRLVQFIGNAAGGPQVYEGQDMATAHTGMAITNAEFDRLGGHLVAALEAAGVPGAERRQLQVIVESTRSAIVQAETTP